MSVDNERVQPDLPRRSENEDGPRPPARAPERSGEVREREDYDEDYERPNRFDTRFGRQRQEDSSHLNILSILFYVKGGLLAVMMSFFLIHVALGTAMVSGSIPPGPGGPPPAVLGWFFIAFGGTFVLFGWVGGTLLGIAGYCLGRRRAYTYCFVMACVACLSVPLGTVLGVFTIIVLMRPSVKALFAEVRDSAAPNGSREAEG